jgi:hypothetical protein
MFTHWFSGEARRWYQASPHRARIDHVGKALRERQYLDVVVREHLHEWLRFTRDLAGRGLALPANIWAPEVREYVAARLPRGSPSRLRFIRAAIRIFLETDAAGNFRRKIAAPAPPAPALFQQWVPPYLAFLQQHRGVSEKTLSKRTFHLRLFAEFLEGRGVCHVSGLSATPIQDFCSHLR